MKTTAMTFDVERLTAAAKKAEDSALIKLFVLCFLSGAFGGTASTLMSVYLPVAVKDLLPEGQAAQLENIGASINAIFLYGWMAGGITWGILCDRIGRKRSFIFATLCYGIFMVLTGFSANWMMVVVYRFLTGFGVGGVLVATTMLVSEAFRDKRRSIALGIVSISFPVGIFSAGLINYFIASWRFGFIVGILPIAIALLSFAMLTDFNRHSTLHVTGNTLMKPNLFAPKFRKNLLAGSFIFGTTLIGLWAIFSWLPSWIQSLTTTADAQRERGISMMLMGAGGLTGGFISGWIAHAIGVRKTMILCFVSCFLLSLTLFKLTVTVSLLLYFQVGLLALFFGISQGALSVYIPQLFPQNVGASATGFCFNIGRLFTATVVFFIGSLVSFLGGYGNAVFTFSFVFLVGLIAMILFKKERYA